MNSLRMTIQNPPIGGMKSILQKITSEKIRIQKISESRQLLIVMLIGMVFMMILGIILVLGWSYESRASQAPSIVSLSPAVPVVRPSPPLLLSPQSSPPPSAVAGSSLSSSVPLPSPASPLPALSPSPSAMAVSPLPVGVPVTEKEEDEESQNAIKAFLFNFESNDDEEEDTPVSFQEIEGNQNLTGRRPWKAPNYSGQEAALGYTSDVFKVPKGLEAAYKFWIDVYSKYNTDQGVVHDAEYMDLIYEVIDFSPISRRTDLSAVQKELQKKHQVKIAKQRVFKTLFKLSRWNEFSNNSSREGGKDEKENSVDSTSSWTDQEKLVWNYFKEMSSDKNSLQRNIKAALSKKRVRFQLGQRDRMVTGIFFSGRYIEAFERIFREGGLPVELTRIPFVESSFNVMARSKVGASGVWQIMRNTGRPYMTINDAIDKRNQPIEAAKTALKLLRNNYKQLKSWPLAITGWNHGPTGLQKLSKRYGTKDLGQIVLLGRKASKGLGFASRNFFISFLAALEVERNAVQYLGPLSWSQPLDTFEVKVPIPLTYTSILDWFGGEDKKLQIFNPHINPSVRRGKLKIPSGVVLSLPKEKEGEIRGKLAQLQPQRK